MNDALQCATDASWFLLHQLMTLDEYRGTIVRTLTAFADSGGIKPRTQTTLGAWKLAPLSHRRAGRSIVCSGT